MILTKTKEKRRKSKLRHIIAGLAFFFITGITLISYTKQAGATCCSCDESCPCTDYHNDTRDVITEEHEDTREFITEQFQFHQEWIFYTFFRTYILPSWMQMTEQLSAVGTQQMAILGTFFDAKQQLEVQRLLQKKEAEAHKDYHPDIEMCVIGTNTRTLAATNRRAEYNTIFMTERSLDRQLGNQNANASEGTREDREGRAAQFIERFCDKSDNNNGLGLMCGAATTATQAANINKDVDYTRVVDRARTLDVDFSDNNLTDDEQNILAMANNLFAHQTFNSPPANVLQIRKNQSKYLDLRSIVAKRSVAENSFNTIIGLKSRGAVDAAANTYDYMGAVIKQLGVTDNDEITEMIGDRPSYFAQMDLLAKKIYQNPDFYTNLYGKPANIKRQDIAMQAVGLMLGRDMYQSDLRSEALMSLLLEMELAKLQEDIQNHIPYIEDDRKEELP